MGVKLARKEPVLRPRELLPASAQRHSDFPGVHVAPRPVWQQVACQLRDEVVVDPRRVRVHDLNELPGLAWLTIVLAVLFLPETERPSQRRSAAVPTPDYDTSESQEPRV